MQRDTRDGVRSAGRLSSVGLELGFAVVGCLVLGAWLDQRFGCEPWLALLGVVVGFAAGFRSLFRALAIHEAEMRNEENRR